MLKSYIREDVEAVFIQRTHASSRLDGEGVWHAGYETAEHIFGEVPSDIRFLIKPNLTVGHMMARSPRYVVREFGITTDVNFVGGVVDRLQELNAQNIAIVEKHPRVFSERGYEAMMNPRNVALACLDKKRYEDRDLRVIDIEGGVVMRKIAVVRPVGDEGTVLVNIPVMKAHNLAILSTAVKNLQGLTPADERRHFCGGLNSIAHLPKDMLQANVEDTLWKNYAKHLEEGYHTRTVTRWTIEDEAWSQRACDMLLAIKPVINIVTGVVARDGTGFHQGTDVLANLVVYGANPINVDSIVAKLMGHNPRQVGYLRIAKERGLGENDPREIPVFEVDPQGKLKKCRDLVEDFGCLCLSVIHRGRGEPIFIR